MNVIDGSTTLVGFSLVTKQSSHLPSSTERGAVRVPLDLVALAQQLWNVELKRSRSLEPMHLTLRLPTIHCSGGGVGGCAPASAYVQNAVATVKAGGAVRVVGTGSVEAVLRVADEVRRLLARLLIAASDDVLAAVSPEEEELWEAVEAATALNTATSPPHAPARLTVDDIFTAPHVTFMRCVVHPALSELTLIHAKAVQLSGEGYVDTDHGSSYRRPGLWLDVSSDEAMGWIADFVSAPADGPSIEELMMKQRPGGEEALADTTASAGGRSLLRPYMHSALLRIRSRVWKSRVRRVSGRTGGVVIQLLWLKTEHSLHVDSNREAVAAGDDGSSFSPPPLLGGTGGEEAMQDDDAEDGDGSAAEWDKVDCVLHSTGRCQVVAKSKPVVCEVVQTVLIPLLVLTARWRRKGNSSTSPQSLT